MWNHPCCPWSPNKTKHRLRFYCCLKRALGSGFVSPPCVIVIVFIVIVLVIVSLSLLLICFAITNIIIIGVNLIYITVEPQQHHPHQQHDHPHDHHPYFSSLLATASLLNSNNGDDGDDPASANDVQSNQRVDLIMRWDLLKSIQLRCENNWSNDDDGGSFTETTVCIFICI